MNFNKFGQFEMTNAQTKKTVGGTQKMQGNGIVRCLTAAPAAANILPYPTHQVPSGIVIMQLYAGTTSI